MAMTTKIARWIFYLGTLSSLVLFLGLTVDTPEEQYIVVGQVLGDGLVGGQHELLDDLMADVVGNEVRSLDATV